MSTELLESFVAPWYDALAHPEGSQQQVLADLLKGYARTEYGTSHGAGSVVDISSYRQAFPIVNYDSLEPYLRRVRSGDYQSLLPEPVVRWVMTRGTTGRPKEIPTTETHLGLILAAGARSIINFSRNGGGSLLERPVLNLNFPSEVAQVEGFGAMGYSSGTYAKLNPSLGPAALVPSQEEIDGVGPGIAREDWDRRFELAYERARGVDIGSTMGVTPVIIAFARYVRRRHGILPRSFWKPGALFCTSVAKIHTKYEPLLRHFFGEVPVVEMYTATEGVFAQQLDSIPYVSPNYDAYLFEAEAAGRVKMLHEMRRGEWGKLIVSTPLFPRYDIGDLVEAQGKGYFRVIGRANWKVRAEHLLFNALTLRWA